MGKPLSPVEQVLRTYACDYCGAKPGDVCVTSYGDRANSSHGARIAPAQPVPQTSPLDRGQLIEVPTELHILVPEDLADDIIAGLTARGRATVPDA